MRLAVCLFLLSHLVAPAAARADAVFDNARGTLRVQDAPCPAEIAVRAKQGTRGYYRFARVTLKDGTKFAACAALATVPGRPGIHVHVIYDDGAEDVIPYSDFRDEDPAPKTNT